jgi:hypothetical protein
MTMDERLRKLIKQCEDEWEMRPFVMLACQDYEDEHWQIYHPDDMRNGAADEPIMPRFVVTKEGLVEPHPG